MVGYGCMEINSFSITDIRQLVVYVVGDRIQLESAWAAVAAWFAEDVPPATLLGVACLGYEGQLVEIDARVIKA